jgi:hypothetical protein
MISIQLHYFLVFVRNDIKKRTGQDNYAEMETSTNARIRLICLFREWFPDTKKSRDLRLNLIMALTGHPISSQNDLSAAQTAALIGVFNGPPTSNSSRELFRELQTLVESVYYFFPWKILDPVTSSLDLPDLRNEDEEDGPHGPARSVDLPGSGSGTSPSLVDQPSM